jgi:membrane protein YqaA with SNARE-associated domain
MDELPAAENTASLQAGPFTINLRVVLSLLALVVITIVSFWAALNPVWIEQAGHWGYLGAALISFLASATVFLPAPGLAVVFSMGGVLNPVLLGILAGIGSGLGELSGYVAGASGRTLVSQQRTHPFVKRFTTRDTAIALFLFAVLPLPLFDFAGIVAAPCDMLGDHGAACIGHERHRLLHVGGSDDRTCSDQERATGNGHAASPCVSHRKKH